MRSFVLILVLLLAGPVIGQPVVHHQLQINVEPATHRISVTDTVTLPQPMTANQAVYFLLHAGMQPAIKNKTGALRSLPGKQAAQRFGVDASLVHRGVPLEAYRLTLPHDGQAVVLQYNGTIHHPIASISEEYARSFSVSPGLIADKGVYLAGSSFWYPHFETDYVNFSMDVQLPADWSSVSQGKRQQHSSPQCRHTCWQISQPQDEIFLIAAPFTEYRQAAGAVDAMVFLRQPDQALAQKYLDVTAQYVEMYRELIGPYPYSKFALVENFWDTGYGMPSFTLLGPKVIRYPFILHSSYPHEILHNWWGNGVFVQYEKGNWAEGLTSYLADHLIKEQRGQGVLYRRTTLQKYTDYVRSNKDFPLTAFRSRHSAVTQAVGYGKTMMLFHMLRLQLGEETFTRGLQQFYSRYRFKFAAYDDVQSVFSKTADTDLAGFFDQWVKRTGAPSLRIMEAKAKPGNGGYALSFIVEQQQNASPYRLTVPLAVTMEGQTQAFQTRLTMKGKRLRATIKTPARPLRLDVDPQFDIFRRLHRNEIPPALTQIFGAEQALIVLPSDVDDTLANAYRQVAQQWQRGQSGIITVTSDDKLDKLPSDRAVWLFGWSNRFRDRFSNALASYDIPLEKDAVTLDKTTLTKTKHAVVMVARHPQQPDMAVTWMASHNPAALPGLARKLPHYGRYSYLGFEGDEPANIVKGQWPVVDSPMSVAVTQADEGKPAAGPAVGEVTLKKRQPLASLPAVFSQSRMVADIDYLASPELAGREPGTEGLDKAAAYIAKQFKQAELKTGGGKPGRYFQTWQQSVGPPKGNIELTNVIGIVPGRDAAMAGQSVVVGAHYDHLGKGWPDSRTESKGKIHPGADDNASGVAVMLELARRIAKNPLPRTVVFAAFTGEEAGLLGSSHYIKHSGDYPTGKIMGMINLDTVGRLGKNKLAVLGTGSAREWVHIFRGTGYVTGVPIQPIPDDFGASDQKAFLDAGVPAVQLFSGAHMDFHRPSDTADKIDAAGLVKVASVLKEAVEHLASRPNPMHANLKNAPQTAKARPAGRQGRRVSLGTIPDFAYQGKGVRITGVTPGSPAEQAGLKDGDIITHINGQSINNLRGFSQALKQLQPEQAIDITFERNKKTKQVKATVMAR